MGAKLPPDWREFFAELTDHEVRFVVIGALAVAAHAEPRFSEDLDVFVQPSAANAKRLRVALIAFGFGDALPVLGRAELIANKRAAGRPKDLRDLEVLEHLGPQRRKSKPTKRTRRPRSR